MSGKPLQITYLALALGALHVLSVTSANAGDSNDQRRQRLERMAQNEPEKLEELRRKKKRFDQLSDTERDRIRRLHEQLSKSADRDRLLRVMRRYEEWLKTLTPEQRTDLQTLNPEDRVAKVKRLKEQQEQGRFVVLNQNQRGLSQQDKTAIFVWANRFVAEHEPEIVERMPPMLRRRYRDSDDQQFRRRMLWSALFLPRLNRDMPRPTADDLDSLRRQLSPKAQRLLDNAPDDRLKLIHRLFQQAVFARAAREVSSAELRKFYVSGLSDEERRQIDRLKPEERLRQLRQKYFQRNFQLWQKRLKLTPRPIRGRRQPGDELR